MQCPIFKGSADGWCLKDTCRHYNQRTDKCTYATYQRLKTEPKDDQDDEQGEVIDNAV